MELLTNLTLIACLCSALAVTCTTVVIVDFLSEASRRYKERYIEETSIQYDDILLQMPPGKIFDLSLAFSAFGAFLAIAAVTFFFGTPSVPKLIFFGFLGLIFAFPIPRVYLRYLKNQRLQKFNEQLEDALLSISGSLKAGFSINQALEEVAALDIRPVSVEFRLLTQEVRLGVPLEQALENMNRRLESDDFALVSTAILTARQTGGELTATLERVAGLIRERVRISNKVRALTAMGRMQALLIGLMPPALFFGMYHINPVMMRSFLHSPIGIIGIILVVLLDIAGYWMIRKIVTIEV